MTNNVMTGSYIDYANNDEVVSFKFYTNLSAYEKVRFVSSVTDTLVGEGGYFSFLKDLIFDFQIVCMFTDVDVSEIKESTNSLNLIEDFLINTNIVSVVKANVEDGLIKELSNSVDENIEYRTGIHRDRLGNALSNLLNTIEDKMKNVDTDSMIEMAKKFSSMTEELTPDSIMEAYMKTDVHKNNIEQVKEVKQKRNKVVDIEKSTGKNKK